MKTESSVEIDAPIDLVFDVTNDDVAKWSLVVVSEETVEETANVVGSRFRSVTSSNGRELTLNGTVTSYERPRHSACTLTSDQFDIDVGYWFEDLAGRTRVTQVSVVSPNGWFLPLLFRFMKGSLSRQSYNAAKREMESLKSYCEFRWQSQNRIQNLNS